MSGHLVHRAGNFPSPSQPPLFPGLPYSHQSSQQDPALLRGWSRVGCLSLSSWVCDHKVILPQEVIPVPKPFLTGTHPWFVPRSKEGSLIWGFFLFLFLGQRGRFPEVTFQSIFSRTSRPEVCLGLSAANGPCAGH